MKQNLKSIGLKVPQKLYDQIEEECQRRGLSISSYARMVLMAAMEKQHRKGEDLEVA